MKSSALVLLLLLVSANAIHADEGAAIRDAEQSARAWLMLTDGGRFEESWDRASTLFQAGITKSEWTRTAAGVRTPLGRRTSRSVDSAAYSETLTGAPDGHYVVIQFATSFENKASAIETLVTMKEKNGTWRVSGYFIR